MARKKLYGNNRPISCDVCEFGRLTVDGQAVLCERHGVVPGYYHCRYFRYDPLKRVPQRPQPLKAFDAAAFSIRDFSLDDYIPEGEAPSVPIDTVLPDDSVPDSSGKESIITSITPPSSDSPLTPEELEHLRSYLETTDSPTLEGLLTSVRHPFDFSDIDSLPDADDPIAPAPTDSEGTDEDSGEASDSVRLVPDDSDDILGDLERLSGSEAAAPEILFAEDMTPEDLASFAEGALDLSHIRSTFQTPYSDDEQFRFFAEETEEEPDVDFSDSLVFLTDDDLEDDEEGHDSVPPEAEALTYMSFDDEDEEDDTL
ncbi:MAG: hypothetical protein IJU16_04150 [Clostridia bacterium]|nr:hypothetical protein [Clostridia bacterium]